MGPGQTLSPGTVPRSRRTGACWDPHLYAPCKTRLLQTRCVGEHLVTALSSMMGPPCSLVFSPWDGCDLVRATDEVSPRGLASA